MYGSSNLPMTTSGDIVTIKRLLLIPTKESYQDIAQRSYNLECNNANIDGLTNMLNRVHQMKSSGVNDIEVATYSPQLLKLNPMFSGVAKIPNGWNTQRLRFLLETESQIGSMTICSFIQGFSEYHDPTMSGLIDPNMVFYVNSITNVKKYLDPVTGMLTCSPYTNYNVISDVNGENSLDSLERNPSVVTRPYDVMSDIVINSRYGVSNGMMNNVVSDINRIKPTSFIASRKANNNPLSYLSKSITSMIASSSDMSSDIGYDQSDVVERAALIAGEPKMETCGLLTALSRLTGELSVTSFTLAQLTILDPGLESSGKVKLINNSLTVPTFQTFLDSNDTASAIQPTDLNLKATLISNIVPSIMLDNLLTDIGFSISNTSGEPILLITNANSFIEGIDITNYVESFKFKFLTTVFPILSNQNLSSIELHVTCDILGDINIGLNLDNSGLYVFRFPTFADSLYTPVISDNNNATMFREDFRTMLDVTNSFVKSTNKNNIPLDPGGNFGTFY